MIEVIFDDNKNLPPSFLTSEESLRYFRSFEQYENLRTVRLEENWIKSLNSVTMKVTLPQCQQFFAAKNHFSDFSNLPTMPELER